MTGDGVGRFVVAARCSISRDARLDSGSTATRRILPPASRRAIPGSTSICDPWRRCCADTLATDAVMPQSTDRHHVIAVFERGYELLAAAFRDCGAASEAAWRNPIRKNKTPPHQLDCLESLTLQRGLGDGRRLRARRDGRTRDSIRRAAARSSPTMNDAGTGGVDSDGFYGFAE